MSTCGRTIDIRGSGARIRGRIGQATVASDVHRGARAAAHMGAGDGSGDASGDGSGDDSGDDSSANVERMTERKTEIRQTINGERPELRVMAPGAREQTLSLRISVVVFFSAENSAGMESSVRGTHREQNTSVRERPGHGRAGRMAPCARERTARMARHRARVPLRTRRACSGQGPIAREPRASQRIFSWGRTRSARRVAHRRRLRSPRDEGSSRAVRARAARVRGRLERREERTEGNDADWSRTECTRDHMFGSLLWYEHSFLGLN